jgi:hypothetical protein
VAQQKALTGQVHGKTMHFVREEYLKYQQKKKKSTYPFVLHFP